MKEIGGYIELERFRGEMLHESGIRLNCGRNCLAYLIQARGIRKLAVPGFMCDSVFDLCARNHVSLRYYSVGQDFRPEPLELGEDEWFYLMNYYGQLSEEEVREYKARYDRIIVDNAQAYFDEPIPGVDTLYTCRKFFGVPDGAVLFTEVCLDRELEQDESCSHMEHLLGRFERTASEFFSASSANNDRFDHEPLKRMSKLTENLLRGIDYEDVKRRRTENFRFLAENLGGRNALDLTDTEGAFAYPMMIDGAPELRRKMIEARVYIPVLWPNVIEQRAADTMDAQLAANILPLPCDQRYGLEEMRYILGFFI